MIIQRRKGKSKVRGNAREGRKGQGRSLTWGPSTCRIEIYENVLLKHISLVFCPFLCLFVQCSSVEGQLKKKMSSSEFRLTKIGPLKLQNLFSPLPQQMQGQNLPFPSLTFPMWGKLKWNEMHLFWVQTKVERKNHIWGSSPFCKSFLHLSFLSNNSTVGALFHSIELVLVGVAMSGQVWVELTTKVRMHVLNLNPTQWFVWVKTRVGNGAGSSLTLLIFALPRICLDTWWGLWLSYQSQAITIMGSTWTLRTHYQTLVFEINHHKKGFMCN